MGANSAPHTSWLEFGERKDRRGKGRGEGKGGKRNGERKRKGNERERGEERRMGREVREGEGKGAEEKRKGKGKMRQRIEYKLAVLVYRCLHGSAPPYLASDLQRVADLTIAGVSVHR